MGPKKAGMHYADGIIPCLCATMAGIVIVTDPVNIQLARDPADRETSPSDESLNYAT